MGFFNKKEEKDEIIQLRKRNEELELKLKKMEAITENVLLYDTLFEHNEDGFEIIELIYDISDKIIDYRWLRVNSAWEKQVGLKSTKVIGKRASEIFNTDSSFWLEKYDKVSKSGTSNRYEKYSIETNRWLDCFCIPLGEKRVAVLFRDITEKINSEKTLQENEQLYRTLFENTEDAFKIIELIYDKDRAPIDYKYIKINKNFEKQTGITDVVGKNVKQIMPNIEPYWIEMYDKILKSGKSVHFINYNEGTNRWYSVVGFPYSIGQVGILFRDISKQKENEIQLQESEKNSHELIEKLRKIDENKNEFINLFSHELRNPMASAMMSLSLLNNADTNSVQAVKAKETLERQLKHLSTLVDDLLDVTRIKNNKVYLNKEILNINELIENVITDNKANYDINGVDLNLQLSHNPLFIQGDNVRIIQVFNNLLTNSLKFTPNGGSTTIEVEKDDIKSEVVISVKDTGIGLSPNFHIDLFDPFTQVDNSLARSNGGLGLGLSIVKGMVELHGGSVEVYSEGIGKGTLFTVRLPLFIKKVEATNNSIIEEVKSSKSLNILMIDDNKDLAEIMCEMIEFLGYKSEYKLHGMDGILKAKEVKPNVIICDIGLPVMNGYEVAKNIRADNDLNGVYLIALSGYAQAEDIERSIKAGFNIHLSKPISLDTLKSTLNEYARRN